MDWKKCTHFFLYVANSKFSSIYIKISAYMYKYHNLFNAVILDLHLTFLAIFLFVLFPLAFSLPYDVREGFCSSKHDKNVI